MFKIFGFTIENGYKSVPVQNFLTAFTGVFRNNSKLEDLGFTTVNLAAGTEMLCVIPSEGLDQADTLAATLGYRPTTTEEFLGALMTLTEKVELGWCYWVICRLNEDIWHSFSYRYKETKPTRNESLFFFTRKHREGKQGEANMGYCALYVKK